MSFNARPLTLFGLVVGDLVRCLAKPLPEVEAAEACCRGERFLPAHPPPAVPPPFVLRLVLKRKTSCRVPRLQLHPGFWITCVLTLIYAASISRTLLRTSSEADLEASKILSHVCQVVCSHIDHHNSDCVQLIQLFSPVPLSAESLDQSFS